jgi:hypothetical protein
MTTYKSIRVWDGTAWLPVGAQVPQTLEAYGTQSVDLTAGAATRSVTFTAGTFISAPLVFVQLTGANNATIRVSSVTTSGFSAVITGTGTDTVTFSWFAVQPE